MTYLSYIWKIFSSNFALTAIIISNMLVYFYCFRPRFKWYLYPIMVAITYFSLPMLSELSHVFFGTTIPSSVFMSFLGYWDILMMLIAFRSGFWKMISISFILCILNRLFTFWGYMLYIPLNSLIELNVTTQVSVTLAISVMYAIIFLVCWLALNDKCRKLLQTDLTNHNWFVLAFISVSAKLTIDLCSDFVFYINPYSQIKIIWAMIALSNFVLAVIALYIHSTLTTMKHFKLKTATDRFTFEKEAQERYYETQLLNQNELRRMKHDMTGNLNTIFHLLSENNTKEALCYVAKLSDHYESRQRTLYSNDPYLNAVVSNYVAEFIRNDIRFEHDIEAGKVERHHVEMCLILNNALQNALEASLKLPPENRYVKLQVKAKQNHLLFRITNRFNGEIIIDNELPRSTKLEDGHGYGLTSIYDAAKSIGALVVYKVEENIFVLDVSINAKSL